MLFSTVISSPRDNLLPEQTLDLANIYLDNARKAVDPYIALVLCHDTEVSLSQVKKVAKRLKVQAIRKKIATAYDHLAKVLESHEHHDEAQSFFKKAEELWYVRRTNRGGSLVTLLHLIACIHGLLP